MTKAIVTGAAGRLGFSVALGLAEAGYDVISLDLRHNEALPVTQVSVDLTNLDDTIATFGRLRPDVVVQLAAIAVPFSAPEETILSTNVSLAYNALRAGVESGAERFVVASSPTVVGYGSPSGWLPSRLPIDENEPEHPWNAYALSKYVAERTMRMFAASQGDRFRALAFRPCYVISPDEWAGAPTQQGHTVVDRLGDPALSAPALFNYVDARDAADFVIAGLDGLGDIPTAETFFVGAADALAREPLATLLPRYVPGTEELASALTGTAPAFSIDKARTLLGWQPRRSWRTELTKDPGVTV